MVLYTLWEDVHGVRISGKSMKLLFLEILFLEISELGPIDRMIVLILW
jgi:hypothetical protein